jgi:hypothetical protein
MCAESCTARVQIEGCHDFSATFCRVVLLVCMDIVPQHFHMGTDDVGCIARMERLPDICTLLHLGYCPPPHDTFEA